MRGGVAWNPDLPDELVAVLARDEAVRVRFRVLERPHIPYDLLETVEYELDPTVRTNPVPWLWESRHDIGLLDQYSRSRHVVYRRTVAWVPDLTQSIVDRLAGERDFAVRLLLVESNTDTAPLATIREVLMSWHGYSAATIEVRRKAAKHPALPVEAMWKIAAQCGVLRSGA